MNEQTESSDREISALVSFNLGSFGPLLSKYRTKCALVSYHFLGRRCLVLFSRPPPLLFLNKTHTMESKIFSKSHSNLFKCHFVFTNVFSNNLILCDN